MRGSLKTRRGSVSIFILGTLLLGTFPDLAFGHAALLKALPAADSTVKAAPQVDLWFNELLEKGYTVVTVTASTNTISGTNAVNLIRSKPVIDPKDGTHLSVELQPLVAGTYVVEWRVLSRDGHSAPGRFRFQVKP